MSSTRVILILLCVVTVSLTTPPWVPLGRLSSRFSSVNIPTYCTSVNKFISSNRHEYYPIITFADDSPSYDLCPWNFSAKNCSGDTFLDQIVTNLNNDKNRSDAISLFNTCLYCGQDTDEPSEWFDNFRNVLQHYCQFPILYQNLFVHDYIITKENLFQGDFMSKLTMCYCGKGGGWKGNAALFGYRCDAFTRQWIPMAYRFIPLFYAVFMIVILALDSSLLFLPRLIERLRTMSTCQSIFTKISDLRVQTISYLLLSIAFLITEQFISIFIQYSFSMKKFQQVWIPGLFRSVSLLCLACCYATTLIQWLHILVHKKNEEENSESISKPLKIILGIFYLCISVLLPTMLLMYFKLHVPIWIVHLYFASFAGLFLIVFPLGFTIAGIKMFLALRKVSVDHHVLRLKFLWFVILTDIIYIVGVINGIMITICYILGWDYFGLWFGLFGTVTLDMVEIIMFLLLSYILFNGKLLCRCSYFRNSQEVDDETKQLLEQAQNNVEQVQYPQISRRVSLAVLENSSKNVSNI